MNRYPPKNIIKHLRDESNFMCSIKNCSVPYLEYHHFDPPWHVENHHNANGMIALCPIHHRQADGGAWTTKQFHELKKHNSVIDREEILGRFNYLRNEFMLYAGGNFYYKNRYAEIGLGKKRLVWFENVDEGFKALNIELFDQDQRTYFRVENNSWKIAKHIKDVECPPNGKSLKVNFTNGNLVKISFLEIPDVDSLVSKVGNFHSSNLLRDLPITLVSVGLKLKEYKINFQADKLLLGTNTIKGLLSCDNSVGLWLSTD